MLHEFAAQNTHLVTLSFFSFSTTIKLDTTNYIIWKAQILLAIRGNGLEGFINGIKRALTNSQVLNRWASKCNSYREPMIYALVETILIAFELAIDHNV